MMRRGTRTKRRHPTKDKNFKNAILDYPLPALRFLAPSECADLDDSTKITPVRHELPVTRLDWPFRETDVPLQVKLPDGRRDAFVVIVEEETETKAFDIERLAEYTLLAARLLKTRRIVPVVLFLGSGGVEQLLELGTERKLILSFTYETRTLGALRARDEWNTTNPFVCLNLVHMQHEASEHLKVTRHSIERFFDLEPDREKRKKYYRFIEAEARLSDRRRVELRRWMTTKSRWRSQMKTSYDDLMEQGQRKGEKKGQKKGEMKGAAGALLTVLSARRLRLTRVQRSRIVACADPKRLRTWLKRAVTAESVDDVLDPPRKH